MLEKIRRLFFQFFYGILLGLFKLPHLYDPVDKGGWRDASEHVDVVKFKDQFSVLSQYFGARTINFLCVIFGFVENKIIRKNNSKKNTVSSVSYHID